jgi:hypothetical protein
MARGERCPRVAGDRLAGIRCHSERRGLLDGVRYIIRTEIGMLYTSSGITHENDVLGGHAFIEEILVCSQEGFSLRWMWPFVGQC